MSAAVRRALAWKEGRQLRSSLVAAPVTLVLVTQLLVSASLAELWPEALLLALGPVLAAVAGASGLAWERPEAGLEWLRSRAASPARLLRVKLAWQASLLAVTASAVALLASAWPGVRTDGWSRMLEAPFGFAVALATLTWLSAFLWAAGFACVSSTGVTAFAGATLVTWAQGTALLLPGALLAGGRPGEAVAQLGWLWPGFLGPPALFAAWAFRRWDPLAPPWSRRAHATRWGAVALAALLGWAVALRPALEARALLAGLDTAASVTSESSAKAPGLAVHVVRLPDGAERVVFDDGKATRVVLPRGTTWHGWTEHGVPRAVVRWPNGLLRAVHVDGSSSWLMPGVRRLEDLEYRETSR